MESQNDKSWFVYVQSTANDECVRVGDGFDTKYEANRAVLKAWTDTVYRVESRYE